MDQASCQRQPLPVSASHSQALPSIASLTSNLPSTEQSPVRHRPQSEAREARDSGNWSISQGPSKHSSTVSNSTMGLQLQTILNTEDSPSRSSVVDTPSSSRYSSGLHQQTALPPLNPGFDHRHSLDVGSHFDSRRSSVDSRMNVGMNHLAISPCSPYDSQNASRSSLVSNLQQQRGITNPDPRLSIASPLSPMGRNGSRAVPPPRRAPIINPNPRSVSGMPDPMAAAPTKGFPWAFPAEFEPEDRRASSSGESSVEQSTVPSRQNSFAASINSSIFTIDSTHPSQKRLDDIPTTHHHSMQPRSITSLQNAALADATSPGGNYSRTPELRVSHKMAERKRRSEMKNLFDDLNNILPNSPGSKSSKWEILTQSIDYIKNLSRSHDLARAEITRLRPEAEYCRRAQEENERLRNELASVWTALRRSDPGNSHVYGSMTGVLAQQHASTPGSASNVLPPLQQQQHAQSQQQQSHPPPHWGAPASTAMQGVEYGGVRSFEHPHR
ncbi:hypothetical protein P153DRAFT_168994 [Dothidotthia symphoricarpi CBS 119687]|uniref:BHLH domain-containing protein n=1 Tax=Dothidotthia symphoricarpi CBS 119687 TaxID=1392245 RepID=A0A6A6AQ49_9PLEO|nr:uncharacterized protein P153DRAFT_168994 [Dothidotthia symphoricarpi CBS 119687]KAF2132641.1 hypothetical protein P153DRAFT_168994 [Dothidotthia symphoricarpi CBS 119687]